ncbi:MAG: hypothetical protein CL470_03045 [Acidimicrobiaceae bacterium]|nr:hypothetical protein [Acidimicrobiaceae bacterium]
MSLSAGTSSTSRGKDKLILAALLAGFIGGWDASSSFFIFPDIRETIANGNGANASWVLSTPNIVGAALLLQSGRLTDKYGPERLYRFGVYSYIVGVTLSTIAPTLWTLVGSRVISASSQAIMGPAAIAVVLSNTPDDKRNEAVGRWGFYTAVAGALSPIAMSQLIDIFSWRALFALQIPIGFFVALLLVGSAKGSSSKPDPKVEIRFFDSFLTVVSLTALILPIVKAESWGWTSFRTVGLLLFSALLLLVLVSRSGDSPSSPIQTKLLKKRGFFLSSLMSLTAGVAFYAHWLGLILFLTEIWGYSLVKAGLLLTIMPGTMSLLSIYAGQLSDRFGERIVMIPGIFLYSVLYIVFWQFSDTSENLYLLIPALIASGIGMAGVWPTLTSLGADGINENLLGSATAMIHTFQRIGGALGIAIVLAVVGEGTGIDSFDAHRSGILVIAVGGVATFLCSIFLDRKS